MPFVSKVSEYTICLCSSKNLDQTLRIIGLSKYKDLWSTISSESTISSFRHILKRLLRYMFLVTFFIITINDGLLDTVTPNGCPCDLPVPGYTKGDTECKD